MELQRPVIIKNFRTGEERQAIVENDDVIDMSGNKVDWVEWYIMEEVDIAYKFWAAVVFCGYLLCLILGFM